MILLSTTENWADTAIWITLIVSILIGYVFYRLTGADFDERARRDARIDARTNKGPVSGPFDDDTQVIHPGEPHE